jgi:hypothetical protein
MPRISAQIAPWVMISLSFLSAAPKLDVGDCESYSAILCFRAPLPPRADIEQTNETPQMFDPISKPRISALAALLNVPARWPL